MCVEGDGDCEEDEDCTGHLICGNNNCNKWRSLTGGVVYISVNIVKSIIIPFSIITFELIYITIFFTGMIWLCFFIKVSLAHGRRGNGNENIEIEEVPYIFSVH